jgi:DNA-directed RNA polymerase subunit RPC12/RpoP
MATVRLPLDQMLDIAPRISNMATGESLLRGRDLQTFVEEQTQGSSSNGVELSMDQVLLKRTKEICERYKIPFLQLSTIQKKFVTHYRCNQCGLLPLYYLDLLHLKRVRCRKCGQMVSFKKKGKYGKLRKEIAIELTKVTP